MTDPPPSPVSPDPLAGAEPAAPRTGLSRFAVDLSPLRTSREFRLLFTGQGVSFAGTMITYVGVPFQAYALTRSSLAVGLVSLAEILPILAVSLVGGALADVMDRRRLVRLTEAGLLLASVALLLNAVAPHPQVWVLFVAVALAGGVDALQRPALAALTPRLVTRDQLAAASALEGLRGNVGQLVAPAVAGVLIAVIGVPATYGVDIATFVVSLATLSMMRAVPPPPDAQPVSLRTIREGLRYAVRRQELLGSYLVDMNATFFGMPEALFPQVAASYGGPAVLGLLYTAPAAGSLVASVASGWCGAVRRHGRGIAFAAAAWGVAIVGFGLAPSLPPAVLCLAVAGGADMISGIFRMTLWNQTIPDSMRGRMAGIEMVSYTTGPSFGNLEAGLVGALAGVRTSVVSGGVACVVGTVALCAALPRFWRYRATP